MFCWRCGARLLDRAAYCSRCGAAAVTATAGAPGPAGLHSFAPELPEPARLAPSPIPARFTGDGLEYFRIWIVNLALTVVTLGIYSAWAKVRRMQYFYRHTRLADASFEFHGRPLPILRGRFVGLVMLAAYTGVGYISPTVQIGAFAVLAAVMPWLLVQSLRFRWHNSSYRGLRFRFSGTAAGGYRAFLGYGLLTLVTFGLAAPLWHHRLKRYVHGHSSYGRTTFTFGAPSSAFYRVYAKVVGIGIALLMTVVLVAGLIAVGMAAIAFGTGEGGTPRQGTGAVAQVAVVLTAVIIPLGYILVSVTVWAMARVAIQSIVWQHTGLGPHRFVYSLATRRLISVVLVNTAGILLTLGLFKPFADVRLARCMVEALSLVPTGSLDEFVAAEGGEVTAVGDEAAELFDIDIAI